MAPLSIFYLTMLFLCGLPFLSYSLTNSINLLIWYRVYSYEENSNCIMVSVRVC